MRKHFASDNYSGIHPEILSAINEVSQGHMSAYGADSVTKKAEELLRKTFGDVESFFVFNGTAANVLSLGACLSPFEAVICSTYAHINEDEAGAPEHHLGCKLHSLPSTNGKITVNDLRSVCRRDSDQHRVQTRVVSITQSTEYGTVYSPLELKQLSQWCRKNHHYLHIDGARLANAAVSLGIDLRGAALGCDVLSFGATKNGLLMGEAVIFFDKALAKNFKYSRKQGMQLMSKMRFISAQFLAYLKPKKNRTLWKVNAQHANQMAAKFAEKLGNLNLKGKKLLKITQQVQANAIFVSIPKALALELQRHHMFYIWKELPKNQVEVRLMTSFDTSLADIDEFCHRLKSLY